MWWNQNSGLSFLEGTKPMAQGCAVMGVWERTHFYQGSKGGKEWFKKRERLKKSRYLDFPISCPPVICRGQLPGQQTRRGHAVFPGVQSWAALALDLACSSQIWIFGGVVISLKKNYFWCFFALLSHAPPFLCSHSREPLSCLHVLCDQLPSPLPSLAPHSVLPSSIVYPTLPNMYLYKQTLKLGSRRENVRERMMLVFLWLYHLAQCNTSQLHPFPCKLHSVWTSYCHHPFFSWWASRLGL